MPSIPVRRAGWTKMGDQRLNRAGLVKPSGMGTGDSVTLDGYKAKKLSAADFSFDPPEASFAASLGGDAPNNGPMPPAASDFWSLL